MSDLSIRKRLFSPQYLDKWCEKESSNCDTREVILGLMSWLSKLSFLLWLPKMSTNSFGRMLASYINDYESVGEIEGFEGFLQATLGQKENQHFQIYDSKRPHPSNIMQIWRPNQSNKKQNFVPRFHNCYLCHTNATKNDSIFVSRNITGLAKLLMYQASVNARSKAQGISTQDVVERDVDLFPYSQQDKFDVRLRSSELHKSDLFNLQKPEFYNFVIAKNVDWMQFFPLPTDSGICHVFNGKSPTRLFKVIVI